MTYTRYLLNIYIDTASALVATHCEPNMCIWQQSLVNIIARCSMESSKKLRNYFKALKHSLGNELDYSLEESILARKD